MWQIYEVTNTVKVSPKVVADLLALPCAEDIWDGNDVAFNDRLIFNSDHCEHMDYLSQYEDVLDVLKKHKVSGDICFFDPESNGSGPRGWGYRFKKGVLTKLQATLVFSETKSR